MRHIRPVESGRIASPREATITHTTVASKQQRRRLTRNDYVIGRLLVTLFPVLRFDGFHRQHFALQLFLH